MESLEVSKTFCPPTEGTRRSPLHPRPSPQAPSAALSHSPAFRQLSSHSTWEDPLSPTPAPSNTRSLPILPHFLAVPPNAHAESLCVLEMSLLPTGNCKDYRPQTGGGRGGWKDSRPPVLFHSIGVRKVNKIDKIPVPWSVHSRGRWTINITNLHVSEEKLRTGAKRGGGTGMPAGRHVLRKEWSDFEQSREEVRGRRLQKSIPGKGAAGTEAPRL